jgi:hypothetical protein
MRVRRLFVAKLVLSAGALSVGAGCSGTSSIPGLGGDSTAGFCKIARRLPDVAADLDPESVDDPATFDAELRAAVDTYLADLDELASRAPADLEKDIKLLMSAVDQYKFADAIEAKEPLDIYVAEHCAAADTSTT